MSHKSAKSRPSTGLKTTLQHALALDGSFYDEAQYNPRNRQLALVIVVLAGVSHAIGSSIILIINRPIDDQVTLLSLFVACFSTGLTIVAGYYLWTFAIWKIGQWLKPIDPTYNDLLTPIGFAYAPQVLNFLTVIPLLGRPIQLVLAVWSLLAVIVAVREGLDIRTDRAVLLSLIFWLPLQVAIGAVQRWVQ
jgi:Yip1 domain